jgi:hypothetical protein
MMPDAVRKYIDDNCKRSLAELFEFLRMPGMEAVLAGHRQMLKADVGIVIDILKNRTDLPAIYYGAKGLLAVVTEVDGPGIPDDRNEQIMGLFSQPGGQMHRHRVIHRPVARREL